MSDRITMWKIRQAYPAPIQCPTERIITEYDYCVLGACMMFTNHTGETLHSTRFPEPVEMEEVLLEINPQLTEERAEYFSKQIAFQNDANNIEDAWWLLDRALTYCKIL